MISAQRQPGGRYAAWRKIWHGAEALVTAGGWPARLAALLGAPANVAVEHHDVEAPTALGRASTLRIAFAADFHAGPTTQDELIENAVQQLTAVAPDILLLGGDFVSIRAAYARPLARRLEQIPAPLGRFAVLGNHDIWADGPAVERHLLDAGIEVLTNRSTQLPEPFGNVSICGLDDHTSGTPDAAAAFKGSQDVRIVLMHAPSGLLDIGDRRFRVALCGHTHGGQVSLPNGRPIKVAHGPLSRRYNAGRFELGGGRTLLVSRGVGCTTVPVRANAQAAVMTCNIRVVQADGRTLPV